MQVVPQGMRKILNWIKKEYGNPRVFITENGYPDVGPKKDVNRVKYYRVSHQNTNDSLRYSFHRIPIALTRFFPQLYLLEVLKAIHFDGCNVFGYTAWSLLDNFEWFYGFG